MKNWLTTSLAFFALASTMTAFAEPKDKSEKTWLTFKKKVETEVETEVEKVFKDKIVFINGFKDRVLKLGTNVKVTRTIGRARFVDGLFRELKAIGKDTVKVEDGTLFDISNFYALISNTKYRLSDLDRGSALKLLYGGLPVEGKNEAAKDLVRLRAITNYVNSEVAKIEKRKGVRREQMKNERFAKAEYNEMFFANNILINDRFYSPTDLGIPKLILRADVPRSSRVPCAEFKLQVRCPFKGVVVLRLGDKTIAASSMDYTKPADTALGKYTLSGYISKRDLGSNPAITIAKAEIQFICGEIDSNWIARAKGTTHPKNSKQFKTQLIGFSMVKSTYSKVTSTVKVDLKNSIWKAKAYQASRDKEMAPLKPKKVTPVEPAKK